MKKRSKGARDAEDSVGPTVEWHSPSSPKHGTPAEWMAQIPVRLTAQNLLIDRWKRFDARIRAIGGQLLQLQSGWVVVYTPPPDTLSAKKKSKENGSMVAHTEKNP